MTPKTFGLVDLSLDEIFESLAKIEKDAYVVWNKLTSAYPVDYFLGTIEDTYGAFFDQDSQSRLAEQTKAISRELMDKIYIM